MSGLTNEDVRRLLDKADLSPREMLVICERFKIPLPEGVGPVELDSVMRERVRQIEAKALRKIAKAKKREG